MVAAVELAAVQEPFLTLARYIVVVVKFVYDCEVEVLAIVVQVVPPSVEYSQYCTLPEFPPNVSVPELAAAHTVDVPETLPGTVDPPTDIVEVAEYTAGQLEF